MYRILRSVATDVGVDPDTVLAGACDALAAQVDGAMAEGWEPSGGVEVYTRQRQGTTLIWVLQGMRKIPIQVEGTASEAIARMANRRTPK